MNVYISVVPRPTAIVHRTEEISKNVSLDFSEEGELLGIEVLNAASATVEGDE